LRAKKKKKRREEKRREESIGPKNRRLHKDGHVT
jgi:hypothetical protein